MGEVTEVGSEVKAFKVGEIVGVGCMVNSCQTCNSCTWHLEQYCQKKVIWTYSVEDYDGTVTQGGYSTIMVCKQEYVILILCVLWFLCNSDPLLQTIQIKSLNLWKILRIIHLDLEIWWGFVSKSWDFGCVCWWWGWMGQICVEDAYQFATGCSSTIVVCGYYSL